MAGGRGSRFQNQNKGLVLLKNKALIEHVITRIAPQVDQLSISCNRNLDQYQTILDQNRGSFQSTTHNRCLKDDDKDTLSGPLAGISRFLMDCSHEFLFICPCDTPLLPHDLIFRLLNHLKKSKVDACFPSDNHRKQHLILLIKRDAAIYAMQQLRSNTPLSCVRSPSIRDWLSHLNYSELYCNDENLNWSNINDQQELERIDLACDQHSSTS